MNCFITIETEKYNAEEHEYFGDMDFELNLAQMKELVENLFSDEKFHILENTAEFIIINNKDEGDLSKIKSLIEKNPSDKEAYLFEYIDTCDDEELAKMILDVFNCETVANELVSELEDEMNLFIDEILYNQQN